MYSQTSLPFPYARFRDGLQVFSDNPICVTIQFGLASGGFRIIRNCQSPSQTPRHRSLGDTGVFQSVP